MNMNLTKPGVAAFALIATLCTSGPALRADSIYYNAYSSYTVTVDGSSTAFKDTANFNGEKTWLGGSFGVSGVAGAGYTHNLGMVTATFQADPGYVFTGLALDFGPWSYGNVPFLGSHGGAGTWSVPGSTYVGDTNPVDPGLSSMAWSGSGSSGSWNYYRYVDWDGGGGQFQSIMGPFGSYPIQLDAVSYFTVIMNLDFWVHDASGYGVSALGIHPLITGAPPPASTVPDGGIHSMILGAIFLGAFLLRVRIRQVTQS